MSPTAQCLGHFFGGFSLGFVFAGDRELVGCVVQRRDSEPGASRRSMSSGKWRGEKRKRAQGRTAGESGGEKAAAATSADD